MSRDDVTVTPEEMAQAIENAQTAVFRDPPWSPNARAFLALLADRDALRAELERTKGELERVRGLLMVALPHVEASAGAQHLMDGFRPRKRPLDDAVEEIRAALERKDGA